MNSCKEFFEEKSLNSIAHQAFLEAQERGVVEFATAFSMFDLEEVKLDKDLIIDLLEKIQIYGIDEVRNNIDLILVYYQSCYDVKILLKNED